MKNRQYTKETALYSATKENEGIYNAAWYRTLFERSPVSLWEQDYSEVKSLLSNLRQDGIRDMRTYLTAHPEVVSKCVELVRITDVNEASVKLHGVQKKTELLREFPVFLPPDAYDRIRKELVMLAEGKTEFVWKGIRLITMSGAQPVVNLHWLALPNYEETLSKIVVSVVNLEQKQLGVGEQMLRKEKLVSLQQSFMAARLSHQQRLGGFVGESPQMQRVYESIRKAAATDANVVLFGESGTGKELAARTIHAMSDRHNQAFVAVNCASIPETLFEREFFGHCKGAFTGATMNAPGYLDQAQGGTLFLDEVGDLPPMMQAKLLRVIQEGEYYPIGSSEVRRLSVRIIAASNKDLPALMRQGTFRQDLFYRLYVLEIALPALRDHKEDIPLLIEYFLSRHALRSNGKGVREIPGHIVRFFLDYDWPGNVREFQNTLHRYLVTGSLGTMFPTNTILTEPVLIESQSQSLKASIEQFEQEMILKTLWQNKGNRMATAQQLQIDLKTLYRRIKKYSLNP